jgi:hypothetical protein
MANSTIYIDDIFKKINEMKSFMDSITTITQIKNYSTEDENEIRSTLDEFEKVYENFKDTILI